MNKEQQWLSFLAALTALIWTIQQAIENHYCGKARRSLRRRIERLEQRQDEDASEKGQNNGKV